MVDLLIAAALAGALPPTMAEADTPERAVRSFFTALQRQDSAANARLTSSAFYAFDVGKRFHGPELLHMVGDVQASGKVLQWNLTNMDVHTRGNSAWATWENHGAVGTAAALQPMSWQESATLHRSGRRWVVDFLHSNRVEPARTPKP